MVVCKFYIQGSCKFGDRCRNEHPRSFNANDYRGGNQYSNNYNNRGGQSNYNTGYNQSANNQRGGYNNYGGGQQQQRQDQFHWRGGQQGGQQQYGGRDNAGTGKSVSFQDSFGGSNQNSFSALDPGTGGSAGQKSDGQDLKPTEVIEIIKKDVEEWENGKMWPLSCYNPTRSQNCIPGFEDITQDELRFAAYNAEKQQKFEQYKAAVSSLMTTVQQQKDHLKSPSPDLSSRLIDIFKGVYQAGSTDSLGNGDSMFQALIAASGGNSTQPTPAGTTQQGSSFGSTTPTAQPAGSAPGTSGFGSSFTSGTAGTQESTPTSGFGSGSFGSGLGSSGTGLGSSGSGFGTGTSGTGLFGKGVSAQSSTAPPDGLFGKASVAASTAPTTGGGGLFGKGASTPAAPTGLFGKPAAPSGGGLFGQGQSAGAVDNTVYTPLSELTADEKAQFEADSFMIGKIPTRPPPVELIR